MTMPAQAKKADLKGEGTTVRIGARVMAQAGYRHRPRETVNAQRHRGQIALRQARVKFRLKRGRWRMKLSADLADGIVADGDRPIRYVRDAYAEWRPNKRTRVRLGNFKRPYSRLAWESANDTHTISRGLSYRFGIRRRNTNLAYGMRGLGVMVWHKFKTGLGKGRVYASVSQGALDLRTVSVHVLLRQAFGKFFELDMYSTYKRSLVANEGVHSNASGISANLRLKGLHLLTELNAMQNWQVASRPWALGVLGSAYYQALEQNAWSLGPMMAVEWLNVDLSRDGRQALRIAAGAQARIQDIVGVWLEGEWLDDLTDAGGAESLLDRQLRLRLQMSLSL